MSATRALARSAASYSISGGGSDRASSGASSLVLEAVPPSSDGFTLADLVAYNEKHNEANGEDNRDGESHNRSWNGGAEWPTDDAGVLALRARQQRNFLATLCLSQGVPMLLGGDEVGRSQRGNNNAYCQDNELSWYDWEHADHALLEFIRRLSRSAVNTRCSIGAAGSGAPLHGSGISDIGWFALDGRRCRRSIGRRVSPNPRRVSRWRSDRQPRTTGRPHP